MERGELYSELKTLIDPSINGETITLGGIVLAMDADWRDAKHVLDKLVRERVLIKEPRNTYRIAVSTADEDN